MKITKSNLKKLIREVYKMTDEDEDKLRPYAIEKGGHIEDIAKQNSNPDIYRVNVTNLRRAQGRQYPEEIESDRENIQRIHSFPEYQTVVNAFKNGDATAIYSLTYQGTYTAGGKEKILNIPEWITRYGHKTNDAISTKAFLGKIEEIPESLGQIVGIGLIIKGYPVLVSVTDAYSQTHSISPQGLIDHQVNSGFAKRGDITNAVYSIDDWYFRYDEEKIGERGVAHEAILDNWKIVGAVINEKIFKKLSIDQIGINQLNIPVHIISENGKYKGLMD